MAGHVLQVVIEGRHEFGCHVAGMDRQDGLRGGIDRHHNFSDWEVVPQFVACTCWFVRLLFVVLVTHDAPRQQYL